MNIITRIWLLWNLNNGLKFKRSTHLIEFIPWLRKVFLKTISNLGAEDGADAGATPGERIVDKEVFLSLVDKVVVGDGLRFILRDGTEWKA